MSVSNSGGHGVTSVMAGTDHVQAKSAQPQFVPTQGPADHQSPKGSGSFPPATSQRRPQAGPTPGPMSL